MNKLLRPLRIVMSLIFLGASVAYLALSMEPHPVARYAGKLQIIPALVGMTAGISLFWVAVTLLFGRVYCSSVCPLGTLQDAFILLRRKTRKQWRFRPVRKSWLQTEALVVFLLCLVLGFSVVYMVLEPWQMFRNIMSIAHPSRAHIEALHFTLSAGAGVAAGVISLVLMALISYFFGREFCNSFCPAGVAMKLLDRFTIYGIELEPDRCTSCLRCQDVCKSRCIDIASRTIDNSRCIRCFDCIDVCNDDAIHFTSGRSRAATPLMKRTQTHQES